MIKERLTEIYPGASYRRESPLQVEIENPYETPGEWYKGNVHTHSSQGKGPPGRSAPQDVCAAYAQQGYDFLAITDHDIVTDIVPDVDIIVIPGSELSTPALRGHMLALNIEIPIDLSLPNQDRINAVNGQGGISILAHPNVQVAGGWPDETIATLKGFQGIEIFSLLSHYAHPPGYALDRWDAALTRGQRCWGFAGDDAHVLKARNPHTTPDPREYDPHNARFDPIGWLGGWIVVRAAKRARGEIFSAIRNGSFYASTGIEIREIWLEDETIAVVTANAEEIRFIGQDGIALKRIAEEAGTYCIAGNEAYVRVECVNSRGKYAWSQPFHINL